jgi:LacI family transcriptional regulator/LacI family repressor for deo operon, udp, cdd, tsx, nupC, and nupG
MRITSRLDSSNSHAVAVTQTSIARELGLSQVAVSHALRGTGNLTTQTRQRVQETAARLNYRPHGVARQMQSGQTGMLDLWLGVRERVTQLPVPLIRGLQEATAEVGRQITFSRMPDQTVGQKSPLPRVFREHAADGLLINYTHQLPAQTIEFIERFQLPALWLNRQHDHNAVYPDEVSHGRLAGEYLLGLARRRVAFLQCHRGDHFSEVDRWAGLEQACRAGGVEARRSLLNARVGGYYEAHPDEDDRLEQVTALLDGPDRPDAVLAYSQVEAVLVAIAAARLRLDCPRDLAVVTVGTNHSSIFGLRMPTVILPHHEIGVRGIAELMHLIENPGVPRPPLALSGRLAV